MKLVAYLRVSTEVQAEGLGIDVQEAAITEWAGAHEHEIVAEFTDAGVSGSNGLDTRAGLADALTVLRTDDAEGMVVYRLDRLARDLIIQEQLLAEARHAAGRCSPLRRARLPISRTIPATPHER
jgi:DNA invertase Pin-like site-specific DNA recombinase